MRLRTAPSWPPCLISLTIVVIAFIGVIVGDLQTDGAIAGAGIFLALLGFARRAGPDVIRGESPPHLVDPTRTPPMPRSV